MDAHAECQEFCLNPVHPGPCKGWRTQLGVPTAARRDITAPVDPAAIRRQHRTLMQARRRARRRGQPVPPAPARPAQPARPTATPQPAPPPVVSVPVPSRPPPRPVTPPPPADPNRAAVVHAAREVIYGTDPRAHTASRQIAVYKELRRADFGQLLPEEQTHMLGDLSFIATTSRGTNAQHAQTLIDRFTPPGTPLGTTMPQQAAYPPPGAVMGQFRIPEPEGRQGLLSIMPARERGASGDGWTRTADGRTGPWGQYGAAGLMLRHVDAQGVERFLMVERGPGISDPGKWQFPGGAKDQHESFYNGATREVVEELGFDDNALKRARTHGIHVAHHPNVPGWAYTSIAATVDRQIQPDLSTAHARRETSDAKWMTVDEIGELDRRGKLLSPLAGGAINQNVISLFPTRETGPVAVGRPAPITRRQPRLGGSPGSPSPAGPVAIERRRFAQGRNLIANNAAKDELRQWVSSVRRDYRGKTADERLAAITARQGFDQPPTVVSRSEMDRLLATGDYIEAWRGARGTDRAYQRNYRGPTKTAAQINEEFRSGPAFYGTGIFGNGFYLTEDRGIAQRTYADGSANSLVRVLIPKAAQIAAYERMRDEASQQPTSGSRGHVGRQGDLGGGTLQDEGRYAAASGFHGIRIARTSRNRIGESNVAVSRSGQHSYTWLNRSILIVQEAE